MSEKVWLAIEHGGEYEDKWENILYAFHTKEEAQQFKTEWYEEKYKDILDEGSWWKLYDELDEIEQDYYDSKPDSELIHELHPEYSLEVLKKNEDYYFGDKSNVYIEEVEFKN